jgi:hypothetical protein
MGALAIAFDLQATPWFLPVIEQQNEKFCSSVIDFHHLTLKLMIVH